jgi:hypothetical protein
MRTSCNFKLCGTKGYCEITTHCKKEYGGLFVYDPTTNPRIHIKLNAHIKDDPDTIKQTLLHELFEGAMMAHGISYEPTNPNHNGQLFIMTHGEMSKVVDETYETYTDIISKLEL